MGKWISVILACVALVSSPYAVFAQEDTEYSYGTVVEVNKDKNQISISEYDWETDSEMTVTYSMGPDVKLENVDLLEKIAPDTYVDVEYIVAEDGKKVAKVISVYETENEE